MFSEGFVTIPSAFSLEILFKNPFEGWVAQWWSPFLWQ